MNIDLSKLSEKDKDQLIICLCQEIEKLQLQINTNSKNSSKPPSSDQKPNGKPFSNKGDNNLVE